MTDLTAREIALLDVIKKLKFITDSLWHLQGNKSAREMGLWVDQEVKRIKEL